MYQYPSPKYDITNNIIDIDLNSKESIVKALDFMLTALENYDSLEHHTLKGIGWRDEDGLSFHFRNPENGSFYDPNIQRQFAGSDGKISRYDQSLLDEGRMYVSNESEIVRALVKLPYAYEKLYQYVEKLSQLLYQSEIDNDYSGKSCALTLALHNADAIPLLAEYWRNSETHHSSVEPFDALIKAHGLTVEILTMIFDHMMVCEFAPDPQRRMMSALRKYQEYCDIEINQPALWFSAFDAALALPPLKHMAYVIPKKRDKLCVLFLELTMEEAPGMRKEFEQRADAYPIIPKWLAHYDQKQLLTLLPNQIIINLETKDESEISEALDRMISITKSEVAFNAMINEGEDQSFEWVFGLLDENDAFQQHDGMSCDLEENFFRVAAEYPDLHSKIFEYACQVTKYMEVNVKKLYSNDERYAADSAWLVLSLKDKKYIDYYIRYLRTNDLSHEVYQGSHICDIVFQHGITEETLHLIAARMQMGGQHHDEDLQAINEKFDLVSHFKNYPEDFDLFCRLSVENYNHAYGKPDEDMDEYLWEDLYAENEGAINTAHEKIRTFIENPIGPPRDLALSFDAIQVSDAKIESPVKIVQPFEYPEEDYTPLISQDYAAIFESSPGLKQFWEFDGHFTATDIDRGTGYFWLCNYDNGQNVLLGIDLKKPNKIEKQIPLDFYVSELAANNGIAILATEDSGDHSSKIVALNLKSGKVLYSKHLDAGVSQLSIHPSRQEVAITLKNFDPEEQNDDYDDFEDCINRLYVLNLETGDTLKQFEVYGYYYVFKSMIYSIDGHLLCVSFEENSYILRTSDLSIKFKTRSHGRVIGDTYENRFSIMYSNKITQHEFQQPKIISGIETPKKFDRFYRMGCYLPGDRIVASDGYNDEENVLDYFDLDSGRLITTLNMSGYRFKSILYHPDTTSLILVTREAECMIWDWDSIDKSFTNLLAEEH